MSYTFTPVTDADLPMLHRWLSEPHVRRWWGDPDHEIALIIESLGLSSMGCYVAAFEGRPFAYIQWWDAKYWQEFEDEPDGTLGIDPFIGEPDMMGRGHGSRMVAAFLRLLFERGAQRIIIDPDPENTTAIRAYEKAGFRFAGVRETRDGSVHFMIAERDDKAPNP